MNCARCKEMWGVQIMRLIDAKELIKQFNNKGIHIEFDLPVEQVLGEDVDLDDFAMLMQDGVMAYKKMVLATIDNQQTIYDIDKVIEELKKKTIYPNLEVNAQFIELNEAIEIVRRGGKNE